MTSRPVRRRGARPFRHGLPLDAGTLLAAALIIGLLLRALIAGILLPQSGFRIDIGDFTAWANRLASLGPGEFYETGYFSDYPPGYLYVLWLLGVVGSWLTPLVGQPATGGLVKIPGVLADIGVAWLLFVYCRRFLDHRFGLRGRSWSGEALGLTAAVIYLFNPVTIFNSAIWGQVDSVGTLVMLATLYALARGWTEGAALGAVVALLIKFQYGFLIPIVALVGIRRHLLGRSSDPAHDGRRDPVRILTSLAVGIGSLVALLAPFGMTLWHPSGRSDDEPDPQVRRGGQDLRGPDDQRLQPVAHAVERARRHAAVGMRRAVARLAGLREARGSPSCSAAPPSRGRR